jgi:hypothetical protein
MYDEQTGLIWTDGALTFRQGIGILAHYGVEGETADVRRAALRCVANALLLDSKMRQIFVNTGLAGKLAERLKVCLLEYRIERSLTGVDKFI